mgnify:CR=1 FL=1
MLSEFNSKEEIILLKIKSYVSNIFTEKTEIIKENIKRKLKELRYTLPLEDAYNKYLEVLDLPKYPIGFDDSVEIRYFMGRFLPPPRIFGHEDILWRLL